MQHETQKPVALLRLPNVLERISLSRSPLLEMVKNGDFPQPIRLGARAVAWVESEVDEWIQQRMLARDNRPAK